MRVDNGVAEMPPELIETLWNVNYGINYQSNGRKVKN